MTDWRPTAPLANLRLRAELLRRTRDFFAARGALEVETPLLAAAPVTDPYLATLTSRFLGPGSPDGRNLFLQTSPEYAMKRLLAAGCGSIYQICKAFRDGEAGRSHNPEFTMLEWYRHGFDHHQLMDEIDDLVRELLDLPQAERLTYRQLFEDHVGVDPHTATIAELGAVAAQNSIVIQNQSQANLDRDDWLLLLFATLIEPQLGRQRPTFVIDYPVSQCALARVTQADTPVAERFELFIDGVELANGYNELCDPDVHRQRFSSDLETRRTLGLPEVPIDDKLLAALDHGIEACAGVALGFDRLVMIAAGAKDIREVLAFPVENA
ncbi:MAG: EF-P lysine aminoacylase GenX [bacterium]|nr:EF-P lysine aminoacylase GenX [bacterium]